jgi:hypothetical protein
VFATKADLVPAAYPRMLRSLFDACTPAPFSVIRRTIEAELGAPLETLFAHVDPTPLATATIAQARAWAAGGGRSVPRVARECCMDLAWALADRRCGDAQVHRGRMHDGRDIVVKVQHAGMEARPTHHTVPHTTHACDTQA